MEPTDGTANRWIPNGRLSDENGPESLQFREEIERLITAPPENGTSFTALLELPTTQAMQLLNSSNSNEVSKRGIIFNGEHNKLYFHPFGENLTAPPSSSPEQHAVKFSGLVGSSVPSNSNATLKKVKSEPIAENNSTPNSSHPSIFDPLMENANQKPGKRKEREKKGKGSAKKSKAEQPDEPEKLPYVHVRARRGQATDSHSLSERARREKINARMKLLQELVPGCNMISGAALVLDEIINHVQSLQRQVEFLSTKLAAIYPRIDFNLDSFFAAESESLLTSNFNSVVTPAAMWPNGTPRPQNLHQWHHDSVLRGTWGRQDDNQNLLTPEHSLLTHDSSLLSESLHSSQLKMEL